MVQRLGQERKCYGEKLIGCLGVWVVTDSVEDGYLADAGGQIGDNAVAFGSGVREIGIGICMP